MHGQRREAGQHGRGPAKHGEFGMLHGPGAHRRAGSGLPNRCRQAEASADIGFHSAIGCSQPGMPWVGANALKMNVSGKKMTSPAAAKPGPGAHAPRLKHARDWGSWHTSPARRGHANSAHKPPARRLTIEATIRLRSDVIR